MDIILIDRDFEICGIIEKYSSLQWNRRYSDVGDFILNLSDEYFSAAKGARYIYHPENDETAVIEDLSYKMNEKGIRTLVLKGRMLESLLSDRVIDKTEILSGNLETALHSLVSFYAMTKSRAISLLEAGAVKGYTDIITMQITGKNLMEALYEILKPYGYSFSLHYDYLENVIKFELWNALDRTQTQNVNTRAVFSTTFENVRKTSYYFNDADYKNFAYVAGAGTGDERYVVTVDQVDDEEERKELYVDARDLQKTVYDESGNASELSDTEYEAMLTARGVAKLNSHARIESAEGSIGCTGNLTYRTDYDVGDICNFEDPYTGLSSVLRITEIREVRENGFLSVDAVFGKSYTVDIRKLIRKETE